MVLIDEELDHVDRISVLAAHLNLSFHPKRRNLLMTPMIKVMTHIPKLILPLRSQFTALLIVVLESDR